MRYALIYAVFVKPIQIKIVYMPRVFRVPQIKPQTDSRESFDMQLRERLEKIASESEISNGKKFKGKWRNEAIMDLIIQYNAKICLLIIYITVYFLFYFNYNTWLFFILL